MNKIFNKIIIFTVILILLTSCSTPQRQPLATPSPRLYETFTTTSAPGLVKETREPNESVVLSNGVWVCTAGGTNAGSHYARLKIKVPELYGIAPTTFYIKATIILPADFYSRQRGGLRVSGVGNSPTTLNGVPVGGGGSGKGLFTSFYVHSDGTLRVAGQYGSNAPVYYASLGHLPVGEHVLELYGDIANVAPWYARIDGVQVASGNARLSPSAVPVSERVVTRFVVGIDGAADQDANSISLSVRNITIADYDPNLISSTETPTKSIPSTFTQTITPTLTQIITPTLTLTPTPKANMRMNGTPFYCSRPCMIEVMP